MTNDEKIIKEEELKKYVNSIIKSDIFEQKSNSNTIKNKNSENDPNSPKTGTTSVDRNANLRKPNRALLPNVPKKNR